jgi:hypothetical protein
MPIEISEDVLQNDEFSMITDSNGDLVLEHKPTGGQFKFDSTANKWTPVQGLAMGGADISSAGNVDVGQSIVTQDLTVNGSATGVGGGVKTRTRVFLSSNSTARTIPFDSVSYDPDNNFSTSTFEYTAPESGFFEFYCCVRGSGTTRVLLALVVNGDRKAEVDYQNPDGGDSLDLRDIRNINAGDTVAIENTANADLQSGDKNSYFIARQIE